MIRLKGYMYEKTKNPYVVHGIKNNQVPRGAIAGSSGTFVVVEPPKVIFLIEKESGETFKKNFYSIVKRNSTRKVTEKYGLSLFNKLENREFKNMHELIKEVVKCCK